MSKAQELADEFESSSGAWSRADLDAFGSDCIEELRRLAAENESFRIGVHHLRDNNVALRAARDELLEALKQIVDDGNDSYKCRLIAHAAIQKHGAAS